MPKTKHCSSSDEDDDDCSTDGEVISVGQAVYAGLPSPVPPAILVVPQTPAFAPIAGQRNGGWLAGPGLLLTPTGFFVLDAGVYHADLSVVATYTADPSALPIALNFALVVNGVLVLPPANTNLVLTTGLMNANSLLQFSSAGLLRLKRSDTVSIVAFSGNLNGTPIVINDWFINLQFVADDSDCACCE